jgi:hypothetical protein
MEKAGEEMKQLGQSGREIVEWNESGFGPAPVSGCILTGRRRDGERTSPSGTKPSEQSALLLADEPPASHSVNIRFLFENLSDRGD